MRHFGKFAALVVGLGLMLCLGWLLLADRSPVAPVSPPRDQATNSPAAAASSAAAEVSATRTARDSEIAPAPLPSASPVREVVLPPAPNGDFEVVMSDEELTALVNARHGALLPTLRLPPLETSRLQALLVERERAAMEAANAAIQIGMNPERDLATLHRAIEIARSEVDAQVRREFGPHIADACQAFEQSRPARNTVADLALALARANLPLRPEQERKLAHLLSSPSDVPPANITQAIFGNPNRRAPLEPRHLAAAAKILSPSQLETLRRLPDATTP